MREETRKHWISLFMVAAILICLLASTLKVLAAAPLMKGNVITSFTGQQGKVTDRFGNTIVDSNTACPDLLVNLIGDTYGIIPNSILGKYQNELTPSFNVFTGIHSLENAKGSILTTTLLPLSAQEAIASAFNGSNGVCVAIDYTTGDVLCCLSLPSALDTSETALAGSLFNKALNSGYIPGSTMKIVTTVLALEDPNIDLETFTAFCNGELELADGTSVSCTGQHGAVDITEAIGVSCNEFFAALAQSLGIESANHALNSLGIYTDTEETHDQYVDTLWKASSSTTFQDRGFQSTWSLVGQGNTIVNPIDMLSICGAIASGTGETAGPRFVRSIYDQDKDIVRYESKEERIQLIDPEIASSAKEFWRSAYKNWYTDISYGHYSAKTGTIQTSGGNHRALLGYMDAYNVCYFIYVEASISTSELFQIAQTLDDQLRLYYI